MRYPVLVCALSVGILGAPRAEAAGVSKGPWIQHVGATSATVRVEVDPPGPVTVELAGALDGGTTRSVAAGETTALHSIVLDGLTPATRYTYTVRAAGESRVAAFTTAPDKNVPFHFLVYGDNRTDDAAHAAVVRAMTPVKSDFIVNTGDFVEAGDTPSEWRTFFEIEAPLLRERCLFACIGNHELIGGAGESFVKYFGPNETASGAGPEQLQGTFRWGSARFFLVNGMVRYRSGPDRSWLDRVLAQSDDEKDLVWRIVVTHYGPWSSGPHGDNRELWAAGVVDAFKQHKIDLVIAGHDHIYERGWADG
ncbi:MAG TPA: FN3 domain-containing metallophosphoesterase family protein, partial [Labilithrix sp.]